MMILNKVLAAAMAISAISASAETWPSKPIRMVVAWPAGGGSDQVARIVSQKLGELLKQSVIVDNRTGATGSIGAGVVSKSLPDGYTLLMVSPAEAIGGPSAGQKVPYDPVTDFAPVALVGETPLVLAANPKFAANNLVDAIRSAKAQPGKLSYGTPGMGSPQNFAGESLWSQVGVEVTHVPYRGAAPALTDLMGGAIPLAISGMPPVVPQVKAGKLKILAITSAKRSSLLPDVPTISELPGMQNYQFSNWFGIYAPAGTPPAIIDKLAAEVAKVASDPGVKKSLLAAGVEPRLLVGADFTQFLEAERHRYQAVAKDRNIRFEQ